MRRFIIKGSKKRTFIQIRDAIIRCLDSPKTIIQISRNIETSWLTTRRHLNWLILTKKVRILEQRGRKYYIRS